MLKQCQRLLTGFEDAMADGRIRGRKVLVGGGWGQLAARRPAGCCGGRFRPCLVLIRKCCGCGKGKVKATNQVVDDPAVTELPLYATSPVRPPKLTRGAWTEDQQRATIESQNMARVDTGEYKAKENLKVSNVKKTSKGCTIF